MMATKFTACIMVIIDNISNQVAIIRNLVFGWKIKLKNKAFILRPIFWKRKRYRDSNNQNKRKSNKNKT